MSPTCFGVDREKILWVASSDAIAQTTGSGGEVRVLSLNTDDWHILWRVLHDNRVVDRVRGEGGIIVDIFYLRGKEGEEEEGKKTDIGSQAGIVAWKSLTLKSEQTALKIYYVKLKTNSGNYNHYEVK